MTTSPFDASFRRISAAAASAPVLLSMGALIVYPLAALLLQVFFPGVYNYHPSWRFSLQPMASFFQNPLNLTAVANSFWIGAAAAVASAAVGTLTAFGEAAAGGFLRRAIRASVWIIFFSPSYVVATGWVVLLQTGGVMQQVFGLSPNAFGWFFTPGGMLLVMGLRYFPFAHFAVSSALQNIGPEYARAARILGASRARTLVRVWIPLLAPAILAGATIAFADGFGDFGLAAAIVPQMQIPLVSYQIYSALYESPVDFSSAALLSVLVVAVTAAALMVQFLWLNRRSYATLSVAARYTEVDGTPGGRVASGLAAAVAILGFVLPVGATLIQSFWKSDVTGLAWNNWTLSAYAEAFRSGGSALQALLRSGEYAAAAAIVTAVLGLLGAEQMRFRKSLSARTLNVLTVATIAIPGIVLAAGFVFAYNARWLIPLHLVLYGTSLCLGMAYVAGHLPYAIRLELSAMAQIPQSLLTAAQTLGARRYTVIRSIVLPLVQETAIATFLITFTGVIFELPAATLLYPAGQPPFSVLVQSRFNSFLWSEGSALTMVGMAVVFVGYALGNAALRRSMARNGARSARSPADLRGAADASPALD